MTDKDDKSQQQKAAETRKAHDPEAFSKMGKKGAEARHDKSPEEEHRIAQKAAETRKSHDPDAFKKMGEKGGKSRGERQACEGEDEEGEEGNE